MPAVALVVIQIQVLAAIAVFAIVTEVPVVWFVTVCELTLVVVTVLRLEPLTSENVTLGLVPSTTTCTRLSVIAIVV